MSRARTASLILLLVAVSGAASVPVGGTRSFAVDAQNSRAVIAVGKSGLLSFAAGHTHAVETSAISGIVTVDAEDPARSQVRLEFDAAKLRVAEKNEPPADLPKVQQTMLGEQVLDVQRHPRIAFNSTSVSTKCHAGATLDLVVTGDLTLRDVTRTLSVPVSATIETNRLVATGHFPLKQSDYGIKPVTVAGVVSVKDTLDISFTIVGRTASNGSRDQR
jgi:polyisoprenoid-binding protein YceI